MQKASSAHQTRWQKMILSPCLGTLTRLTDAASETLSLTDLKGHLRIDEIDDHDVILLLITAVRRATEEHLGRTLVDSDWTLELDRFPNQGIIIPLPMGPVTSIASVQYRDDADVLQTVNAADYEFDVNGRLRPTTTKVWPSTFDRLNAVIIEYNAGEAHAGNVPEDIKQAMRELVGHYEKNREGSSFTPVILIPMGYDYLLNPHRLYGV